MCTESMINEGCEQETQLNVNVFICCMAFLFIRVFYVSFLHTSYMENTLFTKLKIQTKTSKNNDFKLSNLNLNRLLAWSCLLLLAHAFLGLLSVPHCEFCILFLDSCFNLLFTWLVDSWPLNWILFLDCGPWILYLWNFCACFVFPFGSDFLLLRCAGYLRASYYSLW